MRLLFVADGRSPIALNWIEHFLSKEHEVHLASTYPSEPDTRLAGYHLVPVAFSQAAGYGNRAPRSPSSLRSATTVSLRTKVRQWLGPFTLPGAARRLKEIAETVSPDLVHALRIPYEGMLAAMADLEAPLLVSVWGNDFTLHASATPFLAHYTRLALKGADALHTDCQRDVHLAHGWGFFASKPVVVLPGNGGVQIDIFHPPTEQDLKQRYGSPVVINPRGFRAYVRNDTFFKAIPIILAKLPQVRFICPVMADEPAAHRWIDRLRISGSVELLPRQTRSQMAELFRQAQVAVSPSIHDGTPNTLLEAMACACFPLAGDLESLREWIDHGVNGLLFDPRDPVALASAVIKAIEDGELRSHAAEYNQQLIWERAAYRQVMARAESFYQDLISGGVD